MKGLFKTLAWVVGITASVIAALAVIDRIYNKNRIKGDYLECDVPEVEE